MAQQRVDCFIAILVAQLYKASLIHLVVDHLGVVRVVELAEPASEFIGHGNGLCWQVYALSVRRALMFRQFVPY